MLLNKKLALQSITLQNKLVNPIEAFVRLEQQNMLAFIQAIHLSLGGISRVTRGIMGPSPESQTAFNYLVKHEVRVCFS
jgi:hypothetical protein